LSSAATRPLQLGLEGPDFSGDLCGMDAGNTADSDSDSLHAWLAAEIADVLRLFGGQALHRVDMPALDELECRPYALNSLVLESALDTIDVVPKLWTVLVPVRHETDDVSSQVPPYTAYRRQDRCQRPLLPPRRRGRVLD